MLDQLERGIHKENVVDVLNQYDAQKDKHKGDESLVDTILAEIDLNPSGKNHRACVNQVYNALIAAAKDAGVPQKEITRISKNYESIMSTPKFREQHKNINALFTQLRNAIDKADT